jgi:hypothetical protein
VILEPYAGGLSVAAVEVALSMGYGPGTGARFVSLPRHSKFVARSEGRGPAYVDACLGIPTEGDLPDPLPEIIDRCVAADVVFNTGHLSGPEALRVVEAARRRGATRVLVPASYLDSHTAEAIAAEGAYLEFGFFVMSHATQVGQTMIDKEKHRFPLVQLSAIADIIRRVGPDRRTLGPDHELHQRCDQKPAPGIIGAEDMAIELVLSRRRSAREAVEREAAQLMMFLGDMAYNEARSRARARRNAGDRSGARLWSQVAVTIAKRSGYEIGVKTADRYERDRSLDGKALARPVPDIAASTRPILSTLAEIARGRNVQTGLHNASAYVRNAVGLAKQNAAVSAAAEKSAGRRRDWRLAQMRQQTKSRAASIRPLSGCCQRRGAAPSGADESPFAPALRAAGGGTKPIACFLSISGL